jgi:hypothetical protein
MRRYLVLALLLFAAACGGDDDDDDAVSASTTTTVGADESTTTLVSEPAELAGTTLHADGFVVAPPDGSSTTELRFPADKAAVVTALTDVIGAPDEDGPIEEPCPGYETVDNSVRWIDGGVALLVAGDEVVGWDLREGALLGLDTGIAIGSTRAELEAAYGPAIVIEDTTLDGVEIYYETVALGGLLDADSPDGVITGLWAGATCIFR